MNSPASTTPTNPAPAKRRRLGCQVALLVFIALLLGGGMWAYHLWSSKPAYWLANQQFLATHDNETLLLMATALEQRILATVTDPSSTGSESEDRAVAMSADEVNAWLHIKLGTLLANQNLAMPKEVSEPMIAVENDRLVLAFRYQTERVDQVVSAMFTVVMHEDGRATVKLDAGRVGRLPVPVAITGTALAHPKGDAALGRPGAKNVMESLFAGYTFDPVTPIDQTRQVRLRGYRLTPQGIEATLRSEPRPPKK
ncbi:MAG: hypothetical protein K8S99_03985 [Planctomycetes bacterium]|nr:hypothetical protein [Planctomycetota bacterium]